MKSGVRCVKNDRAIILIIVDVVVETSETGCDVQPLNNMFLECSKTHTEWFEIYYLGKSKHFETNHSSLISLYSEWMRTEECHNFCLQLYFSTGNVVGIINSVRVGIERIVV